MYKLFSRELFIKVHHWNQFLWLSLGDQINNIEKYITIAVNETDL